jgi:hypothetical protein
LPRQETDGRLSFFDGVNGWIGGFCSNSKHLILPSVWHIGCSMVRQLNLTTKDALTVRNEENLEQEVTSLSWLSRLNPHD